MAALAGCLPFDLSNWGNQVLSFPAPVPLTGPRVREVEPNDYIDRVNLVEFDGQVVLGGALRPASSFDFDTFSLGPAQAGDQVVADLIANVGQRHRARAV